jgi:ring-1,2-phenylacetyl-CoA epoxidase subunit PaaD
VSTAYEVAAQVLDPELRVVTIEELGILRAVEEDESGSVRVTITPTYSGCPAMDMIRADLRSALARGGYPDAEVVTVLRPAWSTDLINEAGRAKLAAAGIAPPPAVGSGPVPVRLTVRPADSAGKSASSVRPADSAVRSTSSVQCPRCSSPDTEELSRFSSTACKALRRCRACGEPFEQVKPL